MNTISNGQAAASTPVLTIADGQARVCLNRPDQHNRLEPADHEALVDIFDRVGAAILGQDLFRFLTAGMASGQAVLALDDGALVTLYDGHGNVRTT